ncbi:hypothetical protein FB567DRAFT_23591 [Paraphoma chrysanthemicola]|uniref:Heterokaryon incompatibility domain-containing protein n=1 Tax=Paraphoma chrysanthemicola TaxID=798071 RepID=A0A8K0RH39_9PLEO|nr:hypothetical protein FB567DRAFT_23591 [Paraphoma chrysanthemicola]
MLACRTVGAIRVPDITREENRKTDIVGMPLVELPMTFKDVIEITRAFGPRYLCVDSLCIVQDSKTHWATHVEVMASIYEPAHTTLAAGASGDDAGGFFAVPPEDYTKPSLLELDTGLHTFRLYIRRSVDNPDAEWPMGEILLLMKRDCLRDATFALEAKRYCGSAGKMWFAHAL